MSPFRQSNIESQLRKDSRIYNAAAEPGDVTNAKEDEKLASNKANAYYNVQSPADNAVKAWQIDPYT